ncbi:MAG: cyclase family protein [Planctomycetaceae bacterium]
MLKKLTRMHRAYWLLLVAVAALFTQSAYVFSGKDDESSSIKRWKKGAGWGWIWGEEDEVGSLNAMTPESVSSAMKIATRGNVYDLGITYSRRSFKWPGHSPGEIMSYRSPEGEKRQLDHDFIAPDVNKIATGWHSCALFINDNVATQIDGLGHITAGDDHHWYNGFREGDWGGDFGLRKCDATTIPPIVARGVMLDVAGLKGVDQLDAHYAITPEDVEAVLKRQKTKLMPGDVVLFRTGTLRHWGDDGSNVDVLKKYDTAGITLETAKLLVEQYGAMLIGSDTSGLEVAPAPEGSPTFIPVHNYLLVEQGVHIGEFHYLEDLARDKVYEFCYMATVNKIAGTTAGFTLRPIAIR